MLFIVEGRYLNSSDFFFFFKEKINTKICSLCAAQDGGTVKASSRVDKVSRFLPGKNWTDDKEPLGYDGRGPPNHTQIVRTGGALLCTFPQVLVLVIAQPGDSLKFLCFVPA